MKLKYIFFLSAALSLTGCNDGFLDRGPQDLNDKTFWNTVKDLETYANAFYGILPDGVTNLGDENSDNQIPFKPNSFLWGQYTVPAEDGEWSKNNWRNIRNINYFMTHYQSATGSEKEINQYVAEVRFFRALEYFNKIKTFGDVPWLDKDLDVDSGELFGKKMPRNQVAQKIIEDLKFAIENLPEKGKEAPNRLNADIAKHLLGRVCLNEGTYYKYHTELGYAGEADALLKMAASITDELITKGNYEIYSTGKPEEDYYNLLSWKTRASSRRLSCILTLNLTCAIIMPPDGSGMRKADGPRILQTVFFTRMANRLRQPARRTSRIKAWRKRPRTVTRASSS